jgi:hypothetical protein
VDKRDVLNEGVVVDVVVGVEANGYIMGSPKLKSLQLYHHLQNC